MTRVTWTILAALLCVVTAFAAQQGAEEGADRGSERWRAGDAEGAIASWVAALDGGSDLPLEERARLAYNVGVAEHGRGEPLRAAAWFEAALRAAPRFDDARFNLEIARADAGLGPRTGDDLTATLGDLASRFTRGQSEWLALLGALLFAVAALGEALRGGPAWRRAVVAALLVLPVLVAPLVRHVLSADSRPYMVVDTSGAVARSAPSGSAERVGSLEAGEIVEYVDELPGWTKVAAGDDERWVRAETLFALRL